MAASVIRKLAGSGGFKGADFTNEITQSYIVQVPLNADNTLPNDHVIQALTANGLPAYLESYSPSLPGVIAIDADCSPLAAGDVKNFFRVDVKFSNLPVLDGNTGVSPDTTYSPGPDGQLEPISQAG